MELEGKLYNLYLKIARTVWLMGSCYFCLGILTETQQAGAMAYMFAF